MSWRKKSINFFIYGFGQSINLISPLLVTPYILYVSGEKGLGKIGVSLSICLILMGIIDYSSYLQGTKQIAVNREDKSYLSSLISSVYTYKFFIFSILILPCLVLPLLFFSDYKEVFLLSLPLLLGHVLNPNWVFIGLEKYTATAICNVISKVFYISCVFIFVNGSDDFIWVNFFNGLGSILVYFIAFVWVSKRFNIKINTESFKDGINIIKDDFRLSLSEFSLSIYQFFPIIIVSMFTGAYGAGVFRVIEQIYGVFRTFIFMFFNFSYPIVCKEVQTGAYHNIKTWLQYHLINLILISLGCIIIALFSTEVLVFFKVDTNELNLYNKLLLLALLIPIVTVISQSLRQLLLSLNLMKWYANIVYIFTFINIVLLFIFVPFLGLPGALISMLVTEGIAILLYFIVIINTPKIRI